MNKRLLAALLCLIMVLGFLPARAEAQEQSDTSVTQVTAQEITTESRLDDAVLPQKEDTALYDDETMVTVIVELTGESLLDRFEANGASRLTIGQQVSEYLLSAADQRSQLEKAQDDMIARLSNAIGTEATVTDRWTGVVNAMAVKIPYGKLDEVQAIEGVRQAYVEKVYDRPVTTAGETIDGTYGYSYNMTNLAQVWNAGYTGQGMLVAVLDTGLDLDYTTWGDFVTGVRQVHEAFTDDSFKTDVSELDLRYTDETLALFLQTTQLRATTGSEGQKIDYAGNALYKNLKVPYAADYADGDLNVKPQSSDHGTHVSGTIAGYAETDEGEVIFSGVAPDAQILAMKVFSDSSDATGATESTILNALEDAMLLGADVVNLSLGSDNGFAEDDTATNAAYDRLSAAGIIFMVSAGNSADSAYGNHYEGSSLTENPEVSMMAAPAVYENNLAVASIETGVTSQSVLYWEDTDGTETRAAFQDPNTVAMKATLGEGSYHVIPVDGYGTYEDYYNAGFRSESTDSEVGIALVRRGGGISFTDKINAATQFARSYYDPDKGYYVTEFPVKAVIIYDEDPEATELIYMSVDNAMMTSAFISGQDGNALAQAASAAMEQGEYVTLRVSKEDEIVSSGTGGQMSSFSSWGAGPGLELKPEITAPGGNIWSALPDSTYTPTDYSGVFDDYTGTYGMMSGTSMAAPHMTGIALLVEQAVRQQYRLTAKNAVAELSEHLLVSTAVPVQDENGIYYSPRLQGAGLVNAAAAVTTPAYISVEGANVGKLELKDDPDRTGSYTLTFQVNNISDRDVTYQVSSTLMRPATDTLQSQYGTTEKIMLSSSVVLTQTDHGTVTVPAGQTVTVSKTVTLSDGQKAELDELFPNGTYVEGFITLTNETDPQIGLPVLAFYGDWTAAPIFDSSIWYNEPDDGENLFNNASSMGNTFVGAANTAGFINLGQNVFDPYFGEQCLYRSENFAISPNGDGFLDSINDFVLYQLREAKLVVVEVHDAQTNELYYRDFTTYQFKSLYYDSYGYAIPASQFYFTGSSWGGTDLEGNLLPSGTGCIMTITAYGDGDYGDSVYDAESGLMVTDFESVADGSVTPTFNGHEMDMTGDVLQFPVTVDTVAPKLENNTVSFYTGKDGRTYLTGTVTDVDGSIASVEVHPYVKRTNNRNPDYYGYDIDQLNPFYTEHVYDPATKTLTFTCDVTEYAHTNESWDGESDLYTFEWTGHVFISCGDYGLNDRTYAVTVSNRFGLTLSQTSALLHVGSEFDLSVIDNSGIEGQLVRTSSNPEVATIDEYGKVTALAPGQTTITVSKGEQSAVCVVAVREPTTEVIDFNLTVEHFSGLKPNGTFIVRVTDLEPANVELYQKHWIITEDNPDLYEGLINVAQYDTTGLAGEVYLNYSATGDEEIHVPGASATLAVTLNGVTRTMTIDWEDLYTESTDEDLVSAANFSEQSVYVTQGETATLVAKYNNTSSHNVCDVELYTAVGATNYSFNNPATPAVGLVLDGPDFAPTNSTWSGRLVNTQGYALPENIRVFTRYTYSDGSCYENEVQNYSYYPQYTYDSSTGEIEIFYTPYSETNILVIRADGVESQGNPAGTVSGETYERPEGLYGPFDWTVTEGNGELTTAEGVTVGYETQNLAYYTPSEPGVSYITATTKDGKYSVNFAVISQSVQPESLTLETRELTMTAGDTAAVAATVTPEPSLEKYAAVTWTSFDPDVASVDPETGLITAHSEGYAYILAATTVQTSLETPLIVHVVPCAHENTTTTTVEATCTADGSVTITCDHCGEILSQEILPGGHNYETAVTDPTCTRDGYTTYTCTVCGERHRDDYTPATGHSFEHLVVHPEDGAYGYTQHVCTACGYAYVDSFVEVCPSERFTDVSREAWYHEAVDYVLNAGLMEGMSDTLFVPGGTTNRAQVVVVLYRMAGSPAVSGQMPFVDVAESTWYYDAILWAYQNGIAMGISDTHFAPGQNVNRAQLVTFLYRFAAPQGVVDTAVLDQFPDAVALPAFAAEPFAWAIETGLVNGMDGQLNASGTANRAQLATLLMRFAQLEQ